MKKNMIKTITLSSIALCSCGAVASMIYSSQTPSNDFQQKVVLLAADTGATPPSSGGESSDATKPQDITFSNPNEGIWDRFSTLIIAVSVSSVLVICAISVLLEILYRKKKSKTEYLPDYDL